MKHNLIPILFLWGARLPVIRVPKIYFYETTVEHHSIYDYVNKLRITLKLDGILSYFPKRDFTLEEMQRCDEIEHMFLLPDAETWNTYSETYALNK